MKKTIAWLLLAIMLLVPTAQALAAISLTSNIVTVFGDRRIIVADLDLDSSYRNGGESLTAANFGLFEINYIDFNCDADGYMLEYDYSEAKVIVYADAESTAVAVNEYIPFADVAPDTNAVDLSGVTDIKVFVIGR